MKFVPAKALLRFPSGAVPAFFLFFLVAETVLPQEAVPAEMVRVPEGEFWMGRVHVWLPDEISWVERDRMDDRPAHLVSLDGFDIDRFEITNEDYLRFSEATKRPRPHHWKGGRPSEVQLKRPVYNVTFGDAEAYCTWVGKRLPTEAEWERAARGGLDRKLYPWGDELSARGARGAGGPGAEGATGAETGKKAHFGFPNGPAPVGTYAANGFGLHDMTGNVWEWVSDRYERNYYSISPEKNPPGPRTGAYRIIRGGSWADSDERMLGVHYRNYADPTVKAPTIGFRCARSV